MSNQSGSHKSSNSGLALQSGSSLRTEVLAGALAVLVVAGGVGGWAVAQEPNKQETDKISKFLIMKLSREQSQVLCQSEVFTSCMDFSEQACLELSEKALQQCIVPLPETIQLQDLNSDVLELCPQQVYDEAGYSNDKAAACLEQAYEN